MTTEEAATIIENLARSTQSAQVSSGPAIGVIGIGTPGGGPGVVGIGIAGPGGGTNIGVMATATSGGATATTSQSVTILNEIAKTLRSGGNPDPGRLRTLLGQLAQVAPPLVQTVKSTLELAHVLA